MLALAAGAMARAQETPAEPPRIAASLGERASRREAFKDRAVQDMVRAGLGWLVAHQDEDGRWDADGFMKHDGKERSDGPGNAGHDIGLTGLAVLALLAEADPRDRENIERGVDWLVKQQAGDTGRIGVASLSFIYGHAIATLAMVEAVALLGKERWRPAAAKALDYLLVHRCRGAAWRYDAGGNDNDSSITSWCVSALCTGWRAGFTVAPLSLAEPLQWLDSVTDRNGACGYTMAGEGSSRSVKELQHFPNQKVEALTAAALYCRLQCGGDPSQPLQQAATERLLAHLPVWDDKGSIDFYYWYYGSQAMAQMGKEPRDRWFRTLDKVLAANQRKDGPFAGSWDPLVSAWGSEAGRVGITAWAVLALQARYRTGDLQPLASLPQSPPFATLRSDWSSGRMGAVLQRMAALEKTELGADERSALARLRFYLDVEMAGLEKSFATQRAAEKPDWTRVVQALERARDQFRGSPFGDKAGQELAELMKRDTVRHEVNAGKRLQALRDRPPREKKQLVQELDKLVQQHPGTRAAAEATEWLQQLGRR